MTLFSTLSALQVASITTLDEYEAAFLKLRNQVARWWAEAELPLAELRHIEKTYTHNTERNAAILASLLLATRRHVGRKNALQAAIQQREMLLQSLRMLVGRLDRSSSGLEPSKVLQVTSKPLHAHAAPRC